MSRGYVLPSRHASASAQLKALEAAGVTNTYVEGRNAETFEEVLRALRDGERLSVDHLWNLAADRRELRRRMEAVHAKGGYIYEASTGRDSRVDAAAMVFDAADVLGQVRKGHDPKKAREFGKRGGRPRKDRGISDKDAEAIWFNTVTYSTNADAVKHMGKWTESAAWRRWGPSGRKNGPRPPLAAKPQRKR